MYQMIVKGEYGDADIPDLMFVHESNQAYKQRAEMVNLVGRVIIWAMDHNIKLLVSDDGVQVMDGAVTLKL